MHIYYSLFMFKEAATEETLQKGAACLSIVLVEKVENSFLESKPTRVCRILNLLTNMEFYTALNLA